MEQEKKQTKTYEVFVRTNRQGSKVTDTFEVPIDATEKQIEEIAKEVMYELIEWSYYPLEQEMQ